MNRGVTQWLVPVCTGLGVGLRMEREPPSLLAALLFSTRRLRRLLDGLPLLHDGAWTSGTSGREFLVNPRGREAKEFAIRSRGRRRFTHDRFERSQPPTPRFLSGGWFGRPRFFWSFSHAYFIAVSPRLFPWRSVSCSQQAGTSMSKISCRISEPLASISRVCRRHRDRVRRRDGHATSDLIKSEFCAQRAIGPAIRTMSSESESTRRAATACPWQCRSR